MSGPMTWNGMACPNRIQFGRVHGTAPANGTIELDGAYALPLGSVRALQIGPATYYGIVVKNEVLSSATEETYTSRITMVDWRDRLHDSHIFAALNMQEDDGRYYHILPQDWERQRKTYIIKELDEQDFTEVQEGSVDEIEVLAKETLFSGFLLMSLLARDYNFVFTGSPIALQVLGYSRPENLDWNGGVKVADAIQQILQKNGLQFTVLGTNTLYVSLRGIAESAFSNALVNGTAGICDVGGDEGSIGQELNERGRRALVIGDHNRHEYVFPCKPNWNPLWTFQLCYDTWTLNSLLLAHDLTVLNKVKELPEEYHDAEKHDGRKRNEMTIQEYLDEIAFHTYVVDGSKVVALPEAEEEGEEEEEEAVKEFGLAFPPISDSIEDISIREFNRDELSIGNSVPEYDYQSEPFSAGYNFRNNLASSLLIDSQLKAIVYSAEYLMEQGKDAPFSAFKFFVPQDGARVDVESTINTETCQEEFRIRVTFPEFKAFPDLEAEDKEDFAEWVPDFPLVRLCLNGPIYRYSFGEGGAGIRVREQKRSVSNLYRGYFYDQEVSLFRGNFLQAIIAGPGERPVTAVTADMIADRIAKQMLFHEVINFSGNIRYSTMTGAVPDGLIDSVNTSWDSINNISEVVNFTSGFLDPEATVAFALINQKLDIKTEEDIRREFTIWSMKEELKKRGGKSSTIDKARGRPGGHAAAPAAATLAGRDGTARVKVGEAVIGEEGIPRGAVMIGRSTSP